ncbi:MAG: hypothetical protein WCS94_24690, partial [Verrucomicrobiota bacterium]
MTLILLIGLIAVPLLMIYWGIKQNDRLLQPPTLAGVAILVLVIPQVVGIYQAGANILSSDVINDHGMELAFLIHIIFYAAFAVGYIYSKDRSPYQKIELNNDRILSALFWFGCVLLTASLYANWELSQLCGGGFFAFYRQTTGAYAIEWRGLPVLYINIARLTYPALYCLLFVALKKPSFFRWLLVAMGAFYPLLSIVILGRRTAVMALALTLLIPLQFAKKWNLPRWSVIVMVLGGAVVFYSFTEYRSQDVLNTSVADSAEALSLDSVQTALHGNEKKTSEMAGTISVISAINKTDDFGWGRGIWNATVSLLVPRQFVGENFKKSLTSSWDNSHSLEKVYGGGREYYVAVTGPCGAFCEFWYLGALVFFALGRISRLTWNRANSGSVGYMLLYVGTTPIVV